MNIYWFKRKKDDSYFPLDGDKAASTLYWGKQMKNFEYVGMTNGSTYYEMIKQKPQLQRQKMEKTESGKDIEGGSVMMAPELPEDYAKLKRQAMLADLEEAKKNRVAPPKIRTFVMTQKDLQELPQRDQRFRNATVIRNGQ